MGQGYQNRDYEIIDYQLYNINTEIKMPLRGPAPDELRKGEYIVCVGAAQTFGCYVEEPYPYLLQKELNIPVLNLGVSGAGPSFFKDREAWLKLMNNAKFAIVQVMSGRSASNSMFKSQGRAMLTRVSDQREIASGFAWEEIIKNSSSEQIDFLVQETRKNWEHDMNTLLNKIEVPKILLWFSKRKPNYLEEHNDVYKLLGEFPQLVNDAMLESVKPSADYYVEAISSKGMPQRLYSRFTGEKTSIREGEHLGGHEKKYNNYYPSPEMNRVAFQMLLPVVNQLLDE